MVVAGQLWQSWHLAVVEPSSRGSNLSAVQSELVIVVGCNSDPSLWCC